MPKETLGVAWEGGTFLGHCGAPKGRDTPPPAKQIARHACPCLKVPNEGAACVPTPASEDQRAQRCKQGQTAGLGPDKRRGGAFFPGLEGLVREKKTLSVKGPAHCSS